MDNFDSYGAHSPNGPSRVESYNRESYPARDRDPYRDSRRRSPGEYCSQVRRGSISRLSSAGYGLLHAP